MKYIVVSTAVTDKITLSNGVAQEPILGGAGIYALAGIKVWSDDVKIVTGIGEDFFLEHGAWFDRNNLSTSGLIIKDKHTPRNRIQYFADGEREEAPVYGPDHYRHLKPTAVDVASHCPDVTGIYVFRNTDIQFWQEMIRLKAQYQFKLMWEIAADVAVPEMLGEVTAVLNHTDIFSINKQEAFTLFCVNQIDDAIHALQNLHLPLVYLRIGKEGAYIITPDSTHQIPSIPDVHVVDPTGGGNSSSGAVLVGYCQGKDPITIGIMGSISASFCLAQYGPPPVLDNAIRHKAHQLANQIYQSHGIRNNDS